MNLNRHFVRLLTFVLSTWLGVHGSLHAQQYEWAASNSGAAESEAFSVAIDGEGNVITVGYFVDSVDLDPGGGVFIVHGTGGTWNTFVQKLDSNGHFLWGGAIAGAHNAPEGVQVDGGGNILIYGECWTGYHDFDIGTGVAMQSVTSNVASYILRVDRQGNYRWAKLILHAAPFLFSPASMATDHNGNFYIAGNFTGTADFDLGVGTMLLSCQGAQDGFFAKYDSLGAIWWAKTIGGTGATAACKGISVGSNGIRVIGSFLGAVDFDPSINTLMMTNTDPYQQVFAAGYSNVAVVSWAKQFHSGNYPYVAGSCLDDQGNLAITGMYRGTMDLDPGPGIHNASSPNGFDLFVVKLDPAGNYLWGGATMAGADNVAGRSVCADSHGSFYIAGWFYHAADFDLGVGVHTVTPTTNGVQEAMVLKLTASGEFVWVIHFAGGSGSKSAQAIVDHNNSVYTVGTFRGAADFDPDPNQISLLQGYGSDGFVMKCSQDFCSNFGLRIDSVRGISCLNSIGEVTGSAFGGVRPYSYSWNTLPATLDSVAEPLVRGIYLLQASDANGCVAQRGALVNGPTTAGGFDLQGNLVPLSLRIGFLSRITVDAFNGGCVPVVGVLKLRLDSMVSFQSAVPSPDYVVGDTLVWNLPLQTYDSAHFVATVEFLPDTLLQGHDSLEFGVYIGPIAGDYNVLNNDRNYRFEVRNSHDPNDKSVNPIGPCDAGYVLRGTPLTYTIRFQNTGTAEAVNVVVLDTLDANLDISSVFLVGQSHAMLTQVLPGNVLQFQFLNVHLPDSNANEPQSHGYLIYQAMPLAGIPSGTVVTNGCAIYFDSNPAVLTNSIHNTVVDVIPSCPVGLPEAMGLFSDQLVLSPNPASSAVYLECTHRLGSVRVVSMVGDVVYEKAAMAAWHLSIDVRNWPAGIYIVQVDGESRRLVVLR